MKRLFVPGVPAPRLSPVVELPLHAWNRAETARKQKIRDELDRKAVIIQSLWRGELARCWVLHNLGLLQSRTSSVRKLLFEDRDPNAKQTQERAQIMHTRWLREVGCYLFSVDGFFQLKASTLAAQDAVPQQSALFLRLHTKQTTYQHYLQLSSTFWIHNHEWLSFGYKRGLELHQKRHLAALQEMKEKHGSSDVQEEKPPSPHAEVALHHPPIMDGIDDEMAAALKSPKDAHGYLLECIEHCDDDDTQTTKRMQRFLDVLQQGAATIGFGTHEACHSKSTSLLTVLCQMPQTDSTLSVLDFLLTSGHCDVNWCCLKGYTALMFATLKGNNLAVQHLLENGANAHESTIAGWNPFHVACATDNQEASKRILLQCYGAKASLLPPESLEIVRALTVSQTAPLAIACAAGARTIVPWLLRLKADPNAQNLFGRTALHAAARGGDDHVAKLLLAAGANLVSLANDAITPFFLACQYGHDRVVKALMNAKASYEQTPPVCGISVRRIAEVCGQRHIVSFLDHLMSREHNNDIDFEYNFPKEDRDDGLPTTQAREGVSGLDPQTLAILRRAEKIDRVSCLVDNSESFFDDDRPPSVGDRERLSRAEAIDEKESLQIVRSPQRRKRRKNRKRRKLKKLQLTTAERRELDLIRETKRMLKRDAEGDTRVERRSDVHANAHSDLGPVELPIKAIGRNFPVSNSPRPETTNDEAEPLQPHTKDKLGTPRDLPLLKSTSRRRIHNVTETKLPTL